jgi:hypothetical protein
MLLGAGATTLSSILPLFPQVGNALLMPSYSSSRRLSSLAPPVPPVEQLM